MTGTQSTPNQIIAGQPTNGKNYIKLGPVFLNKNGKRRGYTARLPIQPTAPRIMIFAKDGQVLGKDGTHMGVYAVAKTTTHRNQTNNDWQHFGQAIVTHEGRMIEITFDRIPPRDSEGHLVFSVLERQVGDIDHPATAQTTEAFLDVLFKDLDRRSGADA